MGTILDAIGLLIGIIAIILCIVAVIVLIIVLGIISIPVMIVCGIGMYLLDRFF